MTGARLFAAWLWASALTGCIYTFNNPVALQDAGSVTGAVVLDGGAPGQVVGTRVDLLWSDLSINLGQSGQFVFLDLPDGTYTLRYTVPPATAGGSPTVGELLDIYLPFTTSGVPDTIALGSISVSLPGTVEGTITVDGGAAAGAVVGAFVQDGGAGVIEYEGYTTTTDPTGHYSLALPSGNHALWASTATESASLDIDSLQPAEDRTGQDLALAAPQLPGSQLSGYIVVDPDGAHAPSSVVEPILSDPFTVDLQPSCPACQTRLSFGTAAPAQGVAAAQVSVTGLQAGVFYQVTCSLPSTSPPIPAVVLPNIPIIAGESTFLRQIFMLTQTTLDANGALPLDAGTEDGGEDAGPAADAGSDAGTDAGTDAGVDAGPDAGFDAGLDGGLDAGLDAGTTDAGPPSWTLVGSMGGGADTLIPLPVGGAHELIWSSQGEISVADDSAAPGTFGRPTVIWNGSGGTEAVPDTLVGATGAAGSLNGAAWIDFVNSVALGIEVATQSGQSSWVPQSFTSQYTASGNPNTLSLAFDQSSNLWLSEITNSNQLIISRVGGTSSTLLIPDGGSPAFSVVTSIPCLSPALKGGDGICLALTDGTQTLWVATFNPATGTLVNASPIYTVNPNQTPPVTLGIPSLAQQPAGGPLTVAVSLKSVSTTSYLWTSFSSFANIPTPTPVLVGTSAETGYGDPGLFSWNGQTLFLVEGSAASMDVLLPASSSDGPALPSAAGTATPPYGYLDSSGAINVGLLSSTELQLYTLGP